MQNVNKILIVEDEEQLLRMLQSTLVQAGYEVATAKNGMGALEQLIKGEFGVVLLDLGLPDMDGKEVIQEARAISSAPILVISARASEREKISALDLGANDYVGKPFDTGELLARIRVALRPPRRCKSADATDTPKRGLVIDFDTRRAIIDGQPVRLSRKETELLQLLADAGGSIVPHDEIIQAIWGRSGEADYMNLRVLAWQVRQKIEPDQSAPRFLIAEAGQGYRLKCE
ncbi:response regulator transcription factor [Phenylobacterium montanum]|uniref:Response regulator transcription factor n=1 Tax=Phenylobacterium montanum TaxID=2823693 RepID=A0A975G012_9CAUL|nr:response regulator transcription factor [Caulobacter sp. S6]QUD88595.1 response regulator transcription factor [Caulobacter sp. S6]